MASLKAGAGESYWQALSLSLRSSAPRLGDGLVRNNDHCLMIVGNPHLLQRVTPSVIPVPVRPLRKRSSRPLSTEARSSDDKRRRGRDPGSSWSGSVHRPSPSCILLLLSMRIVRRRVASPAHLRSPDCAPTLTGTWSQSFQISPALPLLIEDASEQIRGQSCKKHALLAKYWSKHYKRISKMSTNGNRNSSGDTANGGIVSEEEVPA
jgi:hypothetical protein